ncbi:MAG TPA: glucokinase [Terriglobales bacterium]|nr:glucokinase [Terriglobales bacterium]
MILAGDIGGTHARLAFFDVSNGRFRMVSDSVFSSRDYRGLDEIVLRFLDDSRLDADAACFGVAGPVHNGRVETSNLPWVVEAKQLAKELKLEQALIINDLEANAWGIATLDAKDVVSLNPGNAQAIGNQGVIAAGTGLGEAGLYWDGLDYRVFACEGGHADFAPRNELEIELQRYLASRYGHVSNERVVSGPGLVNVFHFLRDTGRGTEPSWLSQAMHDGDAAAAISSAAIEGRCALCEQALTLFVSAYGAEAGNLALKLMATGGVFIGGGIAPKILAKLAEPLFLEAFTSKGRMRPLLEGIPVHVITNDKAGLQGAARCAAVRTGSETRSS